MKPHRVVSFLAVGFVLEGCATVFSGSTQLVTVNSNVNGAEVWLGQSLLGKTPLVAAVKRGQEGVLKVHLAGYQDFQVGVNKKINMVAWADVLWGYFSTTATTVDYTTGAMYEYEPSTFMVSLQPLGRSDQQLSDWLRKEKLRGFLLLNGNAVVSDLAAGKGEYIDVLADAFAVNPDDRVKAVERWRTAYAESKTALEFANRMVADLDR